MTDVTAKLWSPPRWLQVWAGVTLALLFALLALGAFVTSFRAGMAVPVWPTRPWHLALVSWSEQEPGFLIEHSHRLLGFLVGGMVSILAIGVWLTERRPVLRWGGFAALLGLLAAFGQLHGSLIREQRLWREAQERIVAAGPSVVAPQPNWLTAAGPTVAALAVVVVFVAAALRFGSAGRGVRALAVALLIGVMFQGLVGGLRVYLDALLGTQLATTHGGFSQIVLALAVAVAVGLRPRTLAPADDRMQHEAAAARWAAATVVVIFTQVIAGALVRHTDNPLGPRLHLILAFGVLAVVILTDRLLGDAPWPIRRLNMLLQLLVGLQIVIGIEAWLIKYAAGFAAALLQPVTVGGAAVRTAHAVVGYALFATAVALALRLRPQRSPTASDERA